MQEYVGAVVDVCGSGGDTALLWRVSDLSNSMVTGASEYCFPIFKLKMIAGSRRNIPQNTYFTWKVVNVLLSAPSEID
jgi:hypothetical protein